MGGTRNALLTFRLIFSLDNPTPLVHCAHGPMPPETPIPAPVPDPSEDAGLMEVVESAAPLLGEVEEDAVSLDEFEEEIPDLSAIQAAFIREYLLDLNATRAYVRAGGSEQHAGPRSAALLRQPLVRHVLTRALENRAVRVGISADAVLHEIVSLSLSSLEHYRIDNNGDIILSASAPETAMRAVQSFKKRIRETYDKDGNLVGRTHDVELKLWDKTKPLHLLAKHVGLKVDRVQLEGPDGGPIPVKVIREIVDVDG